MNKGFKLLWLLAIIALLVGCQLTTTSTTTSQSTNPSTSEPSSTTTEDSSLTTTTDSRFLAIQSEFLRFETLLPAAMVADLVLPEPSTTDYHYQFQVTGVDMLNNTLLHVKLHFDQVIEITLTIEFQSLSQSRLFYVVLLRDQATYEQHLIDSAFEEIELMIQEQLPEVASADFSIPKITYSQTTFQYSVSHSYIFDGRFIFPFLQNGQMMTLSVRVNHQGTIRFLSFPIYLKPFDELSKIPVVSINTLGNQPINSKDEYISATLSMTGFNEANESVPLIVNASLQIRGRGNSSWFSFPKKSYRIKFDDRTAFLTTYKERDWVLISNFADQTLIRNYLAYNLARDINMEFAPSANFIDLYVNGEYLGNYFVSDHIDISSNRINIEKNSPDLDTGYLIELDQRMGDSPDDILGWNYFPLRGYKFAIKDPNPNSSTFTQMHYYYIESYFLDIFNALRDKQNYHGLIDQASFIDWFIVNEIYKNVDVGYSSVFYYRDKGGLLKMGPVWDFDLSSRNQGHVTDEAMRGPFGWYTPLQNKNIWFYHLMQYPEFQSALKVRWNELVDHQIQDMVDSIYSITERIARSRYENFQRWDIIGSNWDWYTAPEIYDAKTYEEQVKLLRDYLITRIEWMDTEINKFA